MSDFRNGLKRFPPAKTAILVFRAISSKHSLFEKMSAIRAFFASNKAYGKLPKNNAFLLRASDLYPRLFDNTQGTPVDPVYFYQDTWCAKKIFQEKPPHHYDVGSSAEFVGTISQFTPTTMVDIRPLGITLPGLSFIKGNILRLPFRDGEVSSLSSLCVIEHIGLGRYGDALDSYGSEKACSELVRVLARDGSLYISVPVDKDNIIYFNAHRAFTRDYLLELCKPLVLVDEKYVYGNNLYDSYDATKGFGTGLYHFKK